MIHLSRLCDSELGSHSLRLDQFVHGVSAEEIDVFEILATVGDLDFRPVFVNADEGNYLIKRTFSIELYLRVLIRNSERFNRRLTYVARLSV